MNPNLKASKATDGPWMDQRSVLVNRLLVGPAVGRHIDKFLGFSRKGRRWCHQDDRESPYGPWVVPISAPEFFEIRILVVIACGM